METTAQDYTDWMDTVKAQRVLYSKGSPCGTIPCKGFCSLMMTAQSRPETRHQIGWNDSSTCVCVGCVELQWLKKKWNVFKSERVPPKNKWSSQKAWCGNKRHSYIMTPCSNSWRGQHESSKVWILWKPTVAYQQLLWSDGVICVDAKLLCS